MSDAIPVLEGTAKIRECPPNRCSSCFGQQPDVRHVDFGANWEGPAFRDEKVAGGQWQHSDDLVLCQNCLTVGLGALGLELAGPAAARAEQLESENQNLRDRLAAALSYIDEVEREQRARASLIDQLSERDG